MAAGAHNARRSHFMRDESMIRSCLVHFTRSFDEKASKNS